MATMTVCFTLDSDKDRDLIRWMDNLPKRKRSEAIREALHVHLGQGGVTLGDVYQAVKELERKLDAGMVMVTSSEPISDDQNEPTEAAAALDALGL